jgi:REP element-mobilizing transposase RayT
MLRGIDKRDVFLSIRDYKKFLNYVEKAQEKSDFVMYAYCLMTNHVHMLLKTDIEEPGDIIRRIAVGYAQYHNLQNGRTGHLFQNRYKSEPVENDSYFITVLRYIHQNPVKAGIVHNIKDYKWSSYNEYFSQNKLIDTTFPIALLGDIKAFEEFMSEANEDKCLEYDPKRRFTDEELIAQISFLNIDLNRLKELDIKTRNETLKKIKVNTEASNRQLSRILGIGRSIIDLIN